MENGSIAVEKIVNDYLQRVEAKLLKTDIQDKKQAITDLKTRIENNRNREKSEDEVDGILQVLRTIGEPDEYVASLNQNGSKPTTVPTRSTLLHVLIVIFLVLFGLPLALGALGALIGLLGGLFGLIIGYIATGLGLALAGIVTMTASLIFLFSPDTILALNAFTGIEIMQFGVLGVNPVLGAMSGIVAGGVLTGIGGLMLYSVQFVFRALGNLLGKLSKWRLPWSAGKKDR